MSAWKGGDVMAENKEQGKKQHKTLRAYLVYDYIFKKTETDWFSQPSFMKK